MNRTKYRKFYLTYNWQDNKFRIIRENVNTPYNPERLLTVHFQKAQSQVLSETAYWLTHNQICTGYYLITNPDIFRPVFSYKRQELLDKVHYGKKKEDEDVENDYSIIKPNLRYARIKYLFAFVRKKELPLDCVKIILSFIQKHL